MVIKITKNNPEWGCRGVTVAVINDNNAFQMLEELVNTGMISYASNFLSLTHGFSDRFRIAAELLMVGVAYQETGTTWRVISIEGDDLGVMSTFMVAETACMLKKQGFKSNVNGHLYKVDGAFITFVHDPRLSGVPIEVIQEMLDRRFRNPVTLM